jgi:hypothetical protein
LRPWHDQKSESEFVSNFYIVCTTVNLRPSNVLRIKNNSKWYVFCFTRLLKSKLTVFSSMKKIGSVIGSAVAALALMSGGAQASLVVYTNQANWEAAVGGYSVEAFDDEPLGTLAIGSNAFDGFSINTALNGSNSENFNAVAGGGDSFNINGTNFARLDFDLSDAVSVVSLVFDSAINAFAADWVSTTNVGGLTATVNSDTLAFNSFLTSPGTGFLGFVASAPFTQLNFGLSGTTDNEAFGMDNVRFGAVPEPTTLALMGLGVAGIGYRRRKQIKAA